jgi:hypothetical protein
MLRYLADGAARSQEHPNETVWSGIADACEDIREMAEAARGSLPVDALCVELKEPAAIRSPTVRGGKERPPA